jgi:hypothetical protein
LKLNNEVEAKNDEIPLDFRHGVLHMPAATVKVVGKRLQFSLREGWDAVDATDGTIHVYD